MSVSALLDPPGAKVGPSEKGMGLEWMSRYWKKRRFYRTIQSVINRTVEQ